MNIEAKPAIYLIFCLGNQKSYIGQSKSVKKRIADHRRQLRDNKHNNQYLQYAYNKYGVDLFDFRVLEYPEDTSVENLTIREQYWIDFFDSMNPDKGFNLKEAGAAGRHNEETRRKMSEVKKGKIQTEEHKQKSKESWEKRLSDPNFVHPSKGYKHTEEYKQKQSEAMKGEKNHRYGTSLAEEQKRKISEFLKGKPKGPATDEARENMKKAQKERVSSPDYVSPRTGKKHSEETKEKLREIRRVAIQKKKEESQTLGLAKSQGISG